MTPKQAYDADVKGCPLYHDGTPRKAWVQLSDIAQLSWVRDPSPRRIYPVCGTVFMLPDAFTWEDVAEARKRWGVSNDMAPLALGWRHGLGAVAWGVPTPSNYVLFHHWRAAREREKRQAIHDRLREELANHGDC